MALMKHIKGSQVRVNKSNLNITVEMINFQCNKRFLSQRVSNKQALKCFAGARQNNPFSWWEYKYRDKLRRIGRKNVNSEDNKNISEIIFENLTLI
jgi:hypothetical protein